MRIDELNSKNVSADVAKANPGLFGNSNLYFGTKVTKTDLEVTTKSNATSKYHAQPTEHNGIVYHSKKEAAKAAELDLRVKAGEISFYLRQVPFTLPGNITYRADFVTFDKDVLGRWWIEIIECKGVWTPEAKLKMKLFKERYPDLSIEVV